jgi:hypothetical protein
MSKNDGHIRCGGPASSALGSCVSFTFDPVDVKITAFWDTASYNVISVPEVLTASIIGRSLKMEAVITSVTSVNFYETTRRIIQEDCHLHARRHKNLESHLVNTGITELEGDAAVFADH